MNDYAYSLQSKCSTTIPLRRSIHGLPQAMSETTQLGRPEDASSLLTDDVHGLV